MKLTILLSMWIATASSQTNCHSNRENSLFCDSLGLEPDVPINANSTLTELTLSGASGSIGIKTFSSMPVLENLELRMCHIKSIEDGALCSSSKLERLLILDCVEFPVLTQSLFNNCDNLENLYFYGHKLAPFTGEFLEPMKNLNKLSLYRSELGEISPKALCAPPKLEILSVEGNSISSTLTKSLFENCNNVSRFRFLCNGIVNIEEGALAGFQDLKIAKFNSLNITHLTKEYLSGLINLEVFSIRNSSISTISEDAFKDFVKLRELNVTFNNLKEFDSALISNCPNMGILELSGNNLTTIDNLKHPNIYFLDVSSNSIEKIDIDTVKLNLPRLGSLDTLWNKMSPEYEESLKQKFPNLNQFSFTNKTEFYLFYGCYSQ